MLEAGVGGVAHRKEGCTQLLSLLEHLGNIYIERAQMRTAARNLIKNLIKPEIAVCS